MSSLHPLLDRQLRLLGLDEQAETLSAASLTTVLNWVSEHYYSMAEERRLLREAFEDELRLEVERRRQMLATLQGAVMLLQDAVGSRADRPALHASVRSVLFDLDPLLESDPRFLSLREHVAQLCDGARDLLSIAAAGAEAERAQARAGELQRAWAPEGGELRVGRVEVAGYCRHASACGGDWWAARALDGDRALIVLGDATGHGADAALVTAAARGALSLSVEALDGLGAGSLLRALNLAVHGAGAGRVNMTCVVAILDGATGELALASAGHPWPYVLRGDGALETARAVGPTLGAQPRARFQETRIALAPGDSVIFYTDGLPECAEKRGRQLGARRVRSTLRASGGARPARMRDALHDAVTQFTGGGRLSDDIAFAIARFG